MDKLSVVNIKVKENSIERNAELVNMTKTVKKHTGKDLFELLPKQPWHDMDFELKGTYAGFANAIRRVMIEELPVICATVKETSVASDDEFVKGLMDVLVKNINLIPVRQSLDKDEANKLIVRLDVFNDTNEVIDVTAADFKIVKEGIKTKKKGGKSSNKVSGGKEKGTAVYEDVSGGTEPVNELSDTGSTGITGITGGDENKIDTGTNLKPVDSPIKTKHTSSDLDIEYVFPNPNITIIRLRPMKYLNIERLEFEVGQGFEDFGKFTLLNNIRYKPVDIEPYDIYTNTGTRSIEHDCSHFSLGFTTAGNIMPKDVMKKTTDYLRINLENLKKHIESATVFKDDPSKKYYETKDISVSKIDDVFHYKFPNQYFTLMNMIAQRCFILDANILHCSAGVDRYDTRLGIIKIKHADTNKILIAAIDACLADIETLQSAF